MIELDGGLIVTPWHPVRINGKWIFPCEVKDGILHMNKPCEAVYSFVLNKHHTMSINGVECVSLGHDFKGDVVGHEYFGS